MRDIFEIVKKLEGLQTVESVMKILDVKRRTAVNYISRLRKLGFVEYYAAGRRKRIYRIGVIKTRLNGEMGLYETVNKYSRIKAIEPYKHVIHGRKISVEEALVLALKTQNFRLILASLNLFAHVKDWKMLNRFAKKEKVQRQIGALYELTKGFIRVRRIDNRIERSMMGGKGSRYVYDRLKTKDFFDIAKRWRVEIPFRKEDLIRLKTG